MPPVPPEALRLARADGRFGAGGYFPDDPVQQQLRWEEWSRWKVLCRRWCEATPRGWPRAMDLWEEKVAEAKRIAG